MPKPFEVIEVAPEEVGRYDAFLAASPQGTLFAGGRWLALLAAHFPGRVFALAFARGGEVRAFVPVWERRSALGSATADVPPLTPYWGPCLPPPAGLRTERLKARDHEVLAAVAAELLRRFRFVRMACHPSLGDVRPFTWAGFASSVRYTSKLPPASPDAFLATVSSTLRNKIKQGEGRRVEESTDAGPLLPLYALTFARQRLKPPVPRPFLPDLVAAFCPTAGKLFYLRDEHGDAVAARLLLWDGRAAYDLLAASGEGGRGPLGAYLFWREISAAWELGRPLDMVGVNVEAIATFKEAFGGTLTPYYVPSAYRSVVSRLLLAVGRRLSP